MTRPSRQPKDELYVSVDVALTNGQEDPAIVQALERLLWTSAHFAEGERLQKEALSLEADASTSLGAQMRTTETLTDAVQRVHAACIDVVSVLRDEVTDPALYRALDLDAPRERYASFSPWLQQNRQLFAAALDDPDNRQALADAGIPASFLEEPRDEVERLASLNASQEREKETYQSSSERLQQVREELRDWYRRFRSRVRRALREQPQKLEAVLPGEAQEARLH